MSVLLRQGNETPHMRNTLKTVYICMHDSQCEGDPHLLKMEMLKRDYISHDQFIAFRHRLEKYIENEFEHMKHKPEYNGSWP